MSPTASRSDDLQSLPNLGPASAGWLAAIGIRNRVDLAELGAVDAYLEARHAFPGRVTLNLLYALQGALLGIGWRDLPASLKESLLREVEQRDEKDRP